MSITKTTDQSQRLGTLLVQAGQLTQLQMDQAMLRLQLERQGSLLTVLVDMGFMPFSTISKFVEKALGMKTFVIGSRKVDPTMIELITLERIQNEWVFPIGIKETTEGKILYLGLVDPLAAMRLSHLEAEIQQRIYPVLISKQDYFAALSNHGLRAPTPAAKEKGPPPLTKTSIPQTPAAQSAKTGTFATSDLLEGSSSDLLGDLILEPNREPTIDPSLKIEQPTKPDLAPKGPNAAPPKNTAKALPVRPAPSTRSAQDRTKTSIDLSPKDEESGENLVIIRPGGYEEEIAFEKRRQGTKASEARAEFAPSKPQSKSAEEEADLTNFSQESQSAASQSNYLGETQKRYREEVLAKLDIESRESGLIRQETYTRELLSRELIELSTKTLVAAYEALPPDLKIEAIINTLIDKGLLTKRDIFVQGATTHVFSTLTDKSPKSGL